MKSPIFIFSLPRSGSTLLQRILMSHKDISSVAEPWLLLPFVYTIKSQGIVTDYQHNVAFEAFNDFIDNLPSKEKDYFDALKNFANTLYEKNCNNNEIYFLDKTPRYYFIIPEIAKIFPDAKFIFLFRNPVHVMSSIIQTWGDGHLNHLYNYEKDLGCGPKALSKGYELLKEKAIAIQYEKYVSNPQKSIKNICEYLEIEYDDSMLKNFNDQNTKGCMGDPTGVREYSHISTASLNKWKTTFNTPFRKKLIYKYIETIDADTLMTQGYSKKEILTEIEQLHVIQSNSMRDRIDYLFSRLMQHINTVNYMKLSAKLESIYSKFLKVFKL